MLSFYSTSKQSENVSLKEAVLQGLASDGGLFMPNKIPTLDPRFFDTIFTLSFQQIAFVVAKHLLCNIIPDDDLRNIIEDSLTFDAPLVKLNERQYVLELFHGPTLSFKDFGACFMAKLVGYFRKNEQRDIHVLAATSGDTGSAVAHGFFDIPGIKVWILYPKGKVSRIQEQQLTTLGKNVTAIELDGAFDDCQNFVKKAFNDKDLLQKIKLTSANSINIARLIPQSFYYFYAYAQLKKSSDPVVISVPSGNFGNLTAGLFAKKMGLPIDRFIAATNINDCVPEFLKTGIFHPRPSKRTISNAMDVGNPSNFARLVDLYNGDLDEIRKDIFGVRFTDSETKEAIIELYTKYRYIVDPHGAVAFCGLQEYQKHAKDTVGIFLGTAHPAKFIDVIEPLIETKIPIPSRLQSALDKNKQAILLKNDYNKLKNLLLS